MGGSTLPPHTTLQNVFLMIGCVVLSLASLNSFYQVRQCAQSIFPLFLQLKLIIC
jgi:hypothetical protein